jgi:hypothetical protein
MNKSAKKGFLLPPAVGYSFRVLFFLFIKHSISLKFLWRTILTLLINLINFPFRLYEKLRINKRFKGLVIENDPVFILGHWRSGTTHLHNILCHDPQMGYTTTYQSVFPDTLFNKAGRFLFEGFARILIPGTRKGDNVTLGTELPQEEEFALGHRTPLCFYYFWMFPRYIKPFYESFIRFSGIDSEVLTSWKEDYKLLIKKALKNTGRQRFLSKNPSNTARITVLLEMFPNARFIHIHRNPIEVYLSTRHFFSKMMPHLQLQSIDKKVLDDHIVQLYKDLMQDYIIQRELIPKGNLVEVSFDELEKDPLSIISSIYKDLALPGYDLAEHHFIDYVTKMKSYKKNTHVISLDLINKIEAEWGFAMKKWNYEIPGHIKISKDEKQA